MFFLSKTFINYTLSRRYLSQGGSFFSLSLPLGLALGLVLGFLLDLGLPFDLAISIYPHFVSGLLLGKYPKLA